MNCRSAPWARALTSTAPARTKFQNKACCQLPIPKVTLEKQLKRCRNQSVTKRISAYIYMGTWASAEIFQGGAKSKFCSAYPFQLVDNATKLDVHKALHPFYTTKKKPKITAIVANRVFPLRKFYVKLAVKYVKLAVKYCNERNGRGEKKTIRP